MTHPLIAEALKKAAIAWITVPDAPERALWCLSNDGALWVVTGPGEQTADGLDTATEAWVTMRGEHGGRIVTWPAAVERIDPDGEQWAAVVPQLAAKRLNAPVDLETLLARWAAQCAVVRLTPAGDPVEAGPTLPDQALTAPPRGGPARRLPRTPFRLHRVRRR